MIIYTRIVDKQTKKYILEEGHPAPPKKKTIVDFCLDITLMCSTGQSALAWLLL